MTDPTQAAFGDRNAPASTKPDTVPAGCYWWTDPDGGLCLMPGCMARIQDPDAECLCDKLASRLARSEKRMQEMREREQYANTWWAALRAAVDAHPGSAEILAETRRRTGR